MIEINNLTTVQIDEEFLKRIAKIVLEGESANWRKKEAELSIALVGQGRMRELNKRYRGKNRVTDVLAFPETKILKEKFPAFATGYGGPSKALRGGGKVGPAQKVSGLGEIVICLREVKKNAKRFGSTFKKELATCLIHGILHLLGCNHEVSEKKAKEMQKKQDYYLSQTES